MIRLKDILLEGMTPDVADTIFSKFGVKNASSLDKGELKNYYIALVKKHHPDKGGKDEDMRFINAAYDVLKNPAAALRPKAPVVNPKDYRTYPKGSNKARLYKVSVQFLFDDESLIAAGKSDYFDLIKIFQMLKLFRIMVNFDPVSPYDEEKEEWRTGKILIYVSSNVQSRDFIINAVRSKIRQYYS
jgi:hypothetical protein